MTAGRTEAERALMARGLALLFGAGGTLVLITLLLPHDASTNDLGVAVPPTLALLVCAWLLLRQRRIRVTTVQATLAVGTILISGCVVYGGASASAYQLMYVWVALYAGYFFSTRTAGLQLVLAGCAYVGALLAQRDTGGTPVPSVHWLMAFGTAGVVAALMASVARRVRQQAADLQSVADVASDDGDDDFRQAICARLRTSSDADAVVLLEPTPARDGLTVTAVSGEPREAQTLRCDSARSVVERVFQRGRPELLPAETPSRLMGSCGGVVQPVLHEGRPIAVLAVSWTRPRHQLADRVKAAAFLFAGETSVGLQRVARTSRERHRRAMDINDNIVQGLVLAKYALERGQSPTAARTIERTLGRARELMNEQLDVLADAPGGVQPGDLVREAPSTPTLAR